MRTSGDALRLITAAAVVTAAALVMLGFEGAVARFHRDFVALVDDLPPMVARALIGAVQVATVTVPLAVVLALLIRRRMRLLSYAALAGSIAFGVDALVMRWLERIEPFASVPSSATDGWIAGATFPESYYVAAAAAVITALNPWMSRRWRRATWALLWLGVAAGLLSATLLPGASVMSLGIGWLSGAALLLAFGAPRSTLREETIVSALARCAISVRELWPMSVGRLRPARYLAETSTGHRLIVKTRSDSERSTDVLYRLYRWGRARNLGDERPFWSPRRAAEHEARGALAAEAAGVRTPHMATMVAIDGYHAMALAYEWVPGRTLDVVGSEELSDEVVSGLWLQVRELRAHRIAHRDLRLANLLLDDHGQGWLLDFGFSELAAGDRLLKSDVAELLVSTALRVGPKRAVTTALEVLGPAPVAAAIGQLQPGALTGASRTALRQHTRLLDELRTIAAAETGANDATLGSPEPVSSRMLLVVLALAIAAYVVMPLLIGGSSAYQRFRDLNLGWALGALLGSIAVPTGSALSILGAVPSRLPFGTTLVAQAASSFVSGVSPGHGAGTAHDIRFLQKRGIDAHEAVTGAGLELIGAGLAHVSLALLFFVWAAMDRLRFSLPSDSTYVVIAVGLAVVSCVLLTTSAVRGPVARRVVPALHHGLTGIRELARRPGRLGLVLGGSVLVTMSHVCVMAAAVKAFGGDLSFLQVGLAYFAGAAIAALAPTPGRIGVAEPAYVAALGVCTLPTEVAVPAVFLFRGATLWLPMATGWLSRRALRARDEI